MGIGYAVLNFKSLEEEIRGDPESIYAGRGWEGASLKMN